MNEEEPGFGVNLKIGLFGNSRSEDWNREWKSTLQQEIELYQLNTSLLISKEEWPGA